MKQRLNVILTCVFVLMLAQGNLFAQDQEGILVGDQWTLLSDKDNLVFEAMKGTCNGRGQLMVKVQNNSDQEVHVFVSLALQEGFRSPQQVMILKANQTVEIGCQPSVAFMPIPLRDGVEPRVNLQYTINKKI